MSCHPQTLAPTEHQSIISMSANYKTTQSFHSFFFTERALFTQLFILFCVNTLHFYYFLTTFVPRHKTLPRNLFSVPLIRPPLGICRIAFLNYWTTTDPIFMQNQNYLDDTLNWEFSLNRLNIGALSALTTYCREFEQSGL